MSRILLALTFLFISSSMALKDIGQQIFISYGGSCFNNFIGINSIEFRCRNTNYGFGAGYQLNKWLNDANELTLDVGVSHYNSTYLFHDTVPQYVVEYTNKITYTNVFFTSEYSFKVVKWLQLNTGVSLNLLLNNKLKDDVVGKRVSWNNENNKSKMLKFYPAYSVGFLLNLTKTIGLKYTYQKSILPVAHTEIEYQGTLYNSKHWQRTLFLSLYYKIQ